MVQVNEFAHECILLNAATLYATGSTVLCDVNSKRPKDKKHDFVRSLWPGQ
eukprot:m.1174596 g.1174596  ORF g.1174596 m.1174596 type:complete len:51 (+) comp24521_c0_seq45:2245-2397(+)